MAIISLKSTSQLIFVMVKGCFFFYLRTEYLIITKISFGFQKVKYTTNTYASNKSCEHGNVMNMLLLLCEGGTLGNWAQGLGLIHLIQDRNRWRALVKKAINLPDP